MCTQWKFVEPGRWGGEISRYTPEIDKKPHPGKTGSGVFGNTLHFQKIIFHGKATMNKSRGLSHALVSYLESLFSQNL